MENGHKCKIDHPLDLKLDTKILRYMSCDKFFNLWCNKELFLSRTDRFDDDFEGTFYTLVYKLEAGITNTNDNPRQSPKDESIQERKKKYASCWTQGDRESMAHWKIYGAHKNSVAIETTVDLLRCSLDQWNSQHLMFGNRNLLGLGCCISKIEYIEHHSDDATLATKQLQDPDIRFKQKNVGYAFEEEIRVLYWTQVEIGKTSDFDWSNGIKISIQPSQLIKKIYVHPQADEWFFDLVKETCVLQGLGELVVWSNLRTPPYQLDTASSKK